MSAIVESSVPPERWLITAVQLERAWPSPMAAKVSVSVPIWLILMRIELATRFWMPFFQDLRVGDEQVVADELHLAAQPLGEVLPQPSQSPSAMPSSMLTIGYLSARWRGCRSIRRRRASGPRRRAGAVLAFACRTRSPRNRGAIAICVPATCNPAWSIASRMSWIAPVARPSARSRLVADGGAQPPAVDDFFSAWKVLGAGAPPRETTARPAG